MGSVEVLVREPVLERGRLTASALVRASSSRQAQLWFSVDERLAPAVAPWADPFLLSVVWLAMFQGADAVAVKGAPVSPSLLRNLDRFQRVWCRWRGRAVVQIDVDEARERPVRPPEVIAAFSGGLDSAATAWRHAPNGAGVDEPALDTALMVHGFDIPLADQEGFRGAEERGRRMLDSIGIELATVDTNIRAVNADWDDAHGLALAAALTLFAGGFGTGLIPSSSTEDLPVAPWGSNPLTDVLLGSETFEVVHDGHTHRVGKVAEIAAWPEARRFIRVCWAGPWKDRNCGRCRKCLGTALAFRTLGIEPECFDQPMSDDDLVTAASWPDKEVFTRLFHYYALEAADARGLDGKWVRTLRDVVCQDQTLLLLDRAQSWRAARQAKSIVVGDA